MKAMILAPLLLASGVLVAGAAGPSAAAERGVQLAEAETPAIGYDPLARPKGVSVIPGAAQPEAGEEEVPLNPEFDNLPDTPGAEQTYYLCSACHSLAIVKQQHLTDARWDYLWTWMIEEQGMPEQTPEDRDAILDYLKRHFSSER